MPHDKVSSRYFILTFSSYKLPLDFIRESRAELTLVCTDCGDRAQAGPLKEQAILWRKHRANLYAILHKHNPDS